MVLASRLATVAENEPDGPAKTSVVLTFLVKELDEVPTMNHASCGAISVLTPSNEADRVAPVALTFEDETAVMFPSPEVPPPDGFQLVVKTALDRVKRPLEEPLAQSNSIL